MVETLGDLRGSAYFNMDGEVKSVRVSCKTWKDEFVLYADCKGFFNDRPGTDSVEVQSRRKRRGLFLYFLGPRVHEIFSDLAD